MDILQRSYTYYYSTCRDISSKCWEELGALKREFKSDTNQYKAIDNLQVTFYSLKDANKNAIKYVDNEEYKYFEKYENNCTLAGQFYDTYETLKRELQ
ncbi:MAG TPA: hypothetical protein DDY58_01215 [Terrisporobacter glycolicus]|uniref:hypothetical protein n=1 Tax=Terrisporobacter TaxID=1505652 RepID=UPI000E8557C8|nr:MULTISPECIES: hypothetical protein [Terrisporobacter]HBI91149.1 hypothetical protein [Terrisporobacter hibernicus]